MQPPVPPSIPRVGMLARVRNRRGIVASIAPYDDNETGRLHLVQVEYKDHDSPHSEERGIKVLQIELPDKLAGIAAWVRPPDEPSLPVVVVNRKHPGERQRFTLAHELGHLVLSLEHSTNSEKAADRFAGAFLIPAEALWTEVGKRRTHLGLNELLLLKKLLGASVQTLAYRCLELGIISQAHHRRLFRQFAEKGWRKPPYPEPKKLASERSTRLERLCRRAVSEDAITETRAEELLGRSLAN